jgi:hypothetical protein
VRTLSILLVGIVFVGVLFLLPSMVNAQSTHVTVYGQLTSHQQCAQPSGYPCSVAFTLTTNGTTPGIPDYVSLDFSQSIVPAATPNDAGMVIYATGYYGTESQCPIANGCPAFFVLVWGLYVPSVLSPPTATGCFTSSNPPTTWYSVQCVTAPNIPLTGASSLAAIVSSELRAFISNPSNLIIIALAIGLAIGLAYLFFRARNK